jgi:hypothetical protein
MKATLAVLAALLVSTIPLNPASAQSPGQYPVTPAAYGSAPGPEASAPTGGCDSCGGKTSWLSKLGLKSGGCNSGGCSGKCGDLSGKCKSWLCRPFPSDAPTCKAQYPLGFPTHPYARSPRDYFMANDP